jgi:multidrug efflux pump
LTVFTRFFIDRPIFSTVISVVFVLAGGVAVFTLPVAQYPEVTPPTVQVTAIYPGAHAIPWQRRSRNRSAASKA